MTDRYNALVVVLDEGLRQYDAEKLMAAIRLLGGVTAVDTYASVQVQIAAARAKAKLQQAKVEKQLLDAGLDIQLLTD